MYEFSKNQSKLASTIAVELEKSGCNVGECIQVLTVHLAGILGRHAPNVVEIERCGAVLGEEITRSAIKLHNLSDIVPGK